MEEIEPENERDVATEDMCEIASEDMCEIAPETGLEDVRIRGRSPPDRCDVRFVLVPREGHPFPGKADPV